ncbi:hypothetical protein KUTeg_017370 [Tegillarca granosa]|uniref:Uncharacterized protein n=1 Tax=Tegillarca granosa TaxID=220873 RepID=A0ABQ9EIH2_TEGGR|nr:hypothetical protein KUTeg_017370 [Tegillarca granosa]
MTPTQDCLNQKKGVARAFLKMIEENLAWTIFWYRYVDHIDDEYMHHIRLSEEMKESFPKFMKKGFSERAHSQGIGRHSNEEIYKLDVMTFVPFRIIWKIKSSLWEDNPTLIDCALFGMLTQIVYVPMNYPMKKVIETECQKYNKVTRTNKDLVLATLG